MVGSTAWSKSEEAFVLMYAERCQRQNLDFKNTVCDELLQNTEKSASWGLITTKLGRLVRTHSKEGVAVPLSQFWKQGISCLDLDTIPIDMLQHMREKDDEWNLGSLETRKETHGDQTMRDAARTESPLLYSGNEPRASTFVGNARETYLEESPPDHRISKRRRASDDEWEDDGSGSEQPRNKKRRGSCGDEVTTHENQLGSTSSRDRVAPGASAPRIRGQATITKPANGGTKRKRPRSPNSIAIIEDGSSIDSEDEITVHEQPNKRAKTTRSALESSGTLRRPTMSPITEAPDTEPPLVQENKQNKKSHGIRPAAAARKRTREKLSLRRREGHNAPKNVQGSQGEEKTITSLVNDTAYIVAYLMQEQAKNGERVPGEVQHRVRCMRNCLEYDPGNLIDIYLRGIRARDAAYDSMRDTMESIIGHTLKRRPDFPEPPNTRTISDRWLYAREAISLAFGITLPQDPKPTPVDAGYIACIVDQLTEDVHKDIEDLPAYLEKLAPYLSSAHLAHTLMSTFFCRWLFSADKICEKTYSDKEFKIYKVMLQAGQADEVQQLDKLGMQQIFADKKIQEALLPVMAEDLGRKMTNLLETIWPGAENPGKLKEAWWMTTAIEMKQMLMISPQDYRIHFCKPGIEFDPTWMEAKDLQGFPIEDKYAQGKKVEACLFPALFEQDPAPFEDIAALEDVLVQHKNFFPSFQEKQNLDFKRLIAKANVAVALDAPPPRVRVPIVPSVYA